MNKEITHGTDVFVINNYKDTVFRKLFRDRTELLALYNAINNSSYANPEELEIVTLDNAIYMNMKNDLAFLVDFNLHLYEHQSTCNPNMPLRFLHYVAKEYEKLVESSLLYRRQLIKIPAPHFVVFYNGIEPLPEKPLFRLSDAFFHQEENPQLELCVLVLNINLGNNAGLMG